MFGLGSLVNNTIKAVDTVADATKDIIDAGFDSVGIDSRKATDVAKTVGMAAAVYVAEDAVVETVIDALSSDEE